MFTAATHTTAKRWKQPSGRGRMDEPLEPAATRVDLRDIMLRDVSQSGSGDSTAESTDKGRRAGRAGQRRASSWGQFSFCERRRF